MKTNMKISSAKFAGSSTQVTQKPARKLPEFAFIGRSNVGKSSLINMLCGNGKLAMTSGTPGKTRLVNHFLINDSWYLVDLPGYGFAKLPEKERAKLQDVIRDYLNHSQEMVMLFVLIDVRHDIGKIEISSSILNKPGKLTDEERLVIESHPVMGYPYLLQYHFPKTVMDIVLYHHEKLDGSGYPAHKTDIPLMVQLVTVTDVYEAIRAKRV